MFTSHDPCSSHQPSQGAISLSSHLLVDDRPSCRCQLSIEGDECECGMPPDYSPISGLLVETGRGKTTDYPIIEVHRPPNTEIKSEKEGR